MKQNNSRNIILACLIPFAITIFDAPEAKAARDTEVAGQLHGEIGIGFHGWAERGRMMEDAEGVGDYATGESGPQFDLRFGVLPGLEFFGHIPLVTSGYQYYSDAVSMCGDENNLSAGTVVDEYTDENENVQPVACRTGSTVYTLPNDNEVLTNPLAVSVPSYTTQGLDDVVFGIRYSPIHEADLGKLGSGRDPARSDFPPLVTWRIELGIILNTGKNFYEGGPGSGANGYRIGTSFSKRIGVADPYFSLVYNRYKSYESTYSEDGSTLDDPLTLQSPNETEILFGVELTPYEDQANSARFSVDFAGGASLLSDSTRISGTVLPSVLTTTESQDGTFGEATTEEGQVGFKLRLRLHYKIFRYLRVQAKGSLEYILPHRLESEYDVILGRTVRSRFGAEMTSTF